MKEVEPRRREGGKLDRINRMIRMIRDRGQRTEDRRQKTGML